MGSLLYLPSKGLRKVFINAWNWYGTLPTCSSGATIANLMTEVDAALFRPFLTFFSKSLTHRLQCILKGIQRYGRNALPL